MNPFGVRRLDAAFRGERRYEKRCRATALQKNTVRAKNLSPLLLTNRKDDIMKNLLLTTLCLLAASYAATEDTVTIEWSPHIGIPKRLTPTISKVSETTIPPRTYSVVDFHNGLACTFFEIGTTSFVFKVEWSQDMKFPANKMDVLFNLGLNPVYWAPIVWELPVVPEQGWKEFQIPFKAFYLHKGGIPPQVGFFCFRPSYIYEEVEEGVWETVTAKREDKAPPPVATAEAGVQEGEKTSPSQGKVAKLNGIVAEQEKSENESNPNRLWLYAGILLLICVGFYFLRRKLKTGN